METAIYIYIYTCMYILHYTYINTIRNVTIQYDVTHKDLKEAANKASPGWGKRAAHKYS